MSATTLASKAAESELKRRIATLEEDLLSARERLARIQQAEQEVETNEDDRRNSRGRNLPFDRRLVKHSSTGAIVRRPIDKRGYCFKWNDRSIGWGGTKWELRFVVLEHGHLSYYRTHTDTAPRYVLSLRGCGIHDDGWKRNRRHRSPRKGDPPLDEPGAYFFVFSVYQRSEHGRDDDTTELMPLLRFSTPSMAEKNQWMQLLSVVCDYCETDEFLDYEAARAAEETLQQQQQVRMAAAMPEAKEGTLPPLFFAPRLAKPRMQRRPSLKSKSSPSKGRTEIGDVDKRDAQSKKAYPPSKPMHRCAQPSYLSGEAKAPNYRGLLNLGIIVLVVSNFRLLLDTIQTHGFVLTKTLAHSSELTRFFESRDAWQDFPVVSGFLLLGLFLMIAFDIEWLLSRKKIDEAVGMILHQINSLSALFVPLVFVWTAVESPTIGFVLVFHALITWMKLVSYAQANEDYRLSANKDSALFLVENLDLEEEELRYPQNITLRNMLYFWCAPTLTYQLAFPKYPVRRWWKIASLSFRLILAGSLVFFLTAQAVMPLLENLIGELESTGGAYTFPLIAKYWLKLSIASTYTWLLVFYLYFHLYLNLSAEILRFGDRVFYKDWWNSCEASSFWRLWNMPVHYWLIRHVYFPCIRLKMGRTGATLAVFFLSAILHELVISVPIHLIRPWSFLGMMAQLPLVGMTKFMYRKLPGSSIGNLMFWISFCVIGQPIAVLLYAIDYQFLKETGETVEIFQANCRFTWWGRCLLGG